MNDPYPHHCDFVPTDFSLVKIAWRQVGSSGAIKAVTRDIDAGPKVQACKVCGLLKVDPKELS